MKSISIGRSSVNDLVINDMSVSSTHACVTVDDNGSIFIRDLGSTNGTYVDGVRITSSTVLHDNSKVRLGYADVDWKRIVGNTDVHTSERKSTVLMNKPKVGTELLTGTKMPPYYSSVNEPREKVIGRDPSCDIRLKASDVSSRHAILSCDDNGVVVVDCGSTNGTFVNGKKIRSKILKSGDKLMISNKYYIDWEQVFPSGIRYHGKSSKKGLKTVLWVLLSILIICVLAVGGWYGAKLFVGPKELNPSEIYKKYKKSVVMIYNSYTFDVSYRDFAISEALSIALDTEVDPKIDHCYIDSDGDVVFGSVSGFGTGFFVSEDGMIMTNRHVVSLLPDEKIRMEERIRNKIQESIVGYAEDEYYRFEDEYRLLMKIADELQVKFRNVSTGIFMNDTYVSSKSDMISCSIFDVSQSEDVDVALIQTNNKMTPNEVDVIVDLNDITNPEDIELGCKIYTIGFPYAVTIGDTPIGLEANNQSGEVTQKRGQYTYGHNITIERGASGSPVFDKYGKFAGIIVSGYLGISQGYNHSVQPVPAKEFYLNHCF